MKNLEEMTAQEQQEWVREQYQKATKYLAEKGLVTTSVTTDDSRYLVPMIAVWKLNLLDKQSFWVITGDVPTDHVEINAAETARDVVRHFSLKWQMQAQSLKDSQDTKELEFSRLLVSRAEGLYDLHNNDVFWQ